MIVRITKIVKIVSSFYYDGNNKSNWIWIIETSLRSQKWLSVSECWRLWLCLRISLIQMNKGLKFWRNCGAASVGEYSSINNWFENVNWPPLRVKKLTFRALALSSERLAKALRSKRQPFNSLRWPIHVFNSVVNTKFPAIGSIQLHTGFEHWHIHARNSKRIIHQTELDRI